MGVSTRHMLHHGPVYGALARAALSGLHQKRAGGLPQVPGPELVRSVRPPPTALIEAFVKELGGDPKSYRGQVPPHLFPQWAFPLAARCFEQLPYPLIKVVNGGCKMDILAPLPVGQELQARAHLSSVKEDESKAMIVVRVVTQTLEGKELLVVEFYAIAPLTRKSNGQHGQAAKPRKDKPSVPPGAHEIARFRLAHDAGLAFAKLTGDFNPIHWSRTYARASGFKDVILQGFGTFARATESLNRNLLAGDINRLKSLSGKFVRPLHLPADVGVYVRDGEIYVGDIVGGPAYMTGHYELGDRS